MHLFLYLGCLYSHRAVAVIPSFKVFELICSHLFVTGPLFIIKKQGQIYILSKQKLQQEDVRDSNYYISLVASIVVAWRRSVFLWYCHYFTGALETVFSVSSTMFISQSYLQLYICRQLEDYCAYLKKTVAVLLLRGACMFERTLVTVLFSFEEYHIKCTKALMH